MLMLYVTFMAQAPFALRALGMMVHIPRSRSIIWDRGFTTTGKCLILTLHSTYANFSSSWLLPPSGP